MRQLTASEVRDETRDRQVFEEIMTEGMPELQRRLTLLRTGEGYRGRDINELWDFWQAALKSKQGEV